MLGLIFFVGYFFYFFVYLKGKIPLIACGSGWR